MRTMFSLINIFNTDTEKNEQTEWQSPVTSSIMNDEETKLNRQTKKQQKKQTIEWNLTRHWNGNLTAVQLSSSVAFSR